MFPDIFKYLYIYIDIYTYIYSTYMYVYIYASHIDIYTDHTYKHVRSWDVCVPT